MSTVEARINELISNFINDVTNIAKEIAMDTLTNVLGGEAIAPPRVSGEKRAPEVLAKIGEELLAHIKENPGQRIEQINAKLGTKTKDIFRPLKKLIAAKQIRTQGDRRSTRYFPADVKPGEALTKEQISRAISEHGSKRAAARALGIANSTFQGACERLGVSS